MGKGDRKKPAPLPKLKQPKPVGRGRRSARRTSLGTFDGEDPRQIVAESRCRQMGDSDTKENRLKNLAPHLGDDVGRCIEYFIGGKTQDQRNEIAELWKVWTGFCASRWHYRRRILGQTGFPSGMNLQILPELYETDQSHSVDDRSEEQRDDDARKSYLIWNGRAEETGVEYCALLHSCENGHVQIMNGTTPNPRGAALVSAIKALRDTGG